MGICGGSMNNSKREDLHFKRHDTIKNIKTLDQFNAEFIRENKKKFKEQYRIEPKILGRGAFGEVRPVVHIASNTMRAVKIIFKQKVSDENLVNLFNEIEVMKAIDFPYIIRVYEYFQDERYVYIVMELGHGKELFDKILDMHHFSERTAALVCKQLLETVSYLHSRHIVHRDLKPENILFDGTTIKIIDFGSSRVFDSKKKMNTVVGSSYYIAPEVINGSYDEKCDVWSLGVILYVMICGQPPFNGETDEQIENAVKKGKFNFDPIEFEQVSPSVKNLISQLLTFNPSARVSAKEALENPWFKEVLTLQEINLDANIINNLKVFQAKSKIQTVLLNFIVQTFLGEEDTKDLKRMFLELDTDHDGVLNAQELKSALKKTNFFLSEAEFTAMMKSADTDNDGMINYTEFISAAIDKSIAVKDELLMKAFKTFDMDDNGKIDLFELKNMLAGNNNIEDNVWNDLLKGVKTDRNMNVTFEEFKNIMIKLIKNGDSST